jgi:hypothetical protein
MQSVPVNFWEWLGSLDSDERTFIIFFSLLAIVVTISIVAAVAYAIHKNRLDDSLKRELLRQGMSADEIATVVRARPSKERRRFLFRRSDY